MQLLHRTTAHHLLSPYGIPFHPVSATSEMVGTTIEELLQHNFPTKNSWENSRFAHYPEEIVVRLNHRSEVRFVLLRAKMDRPIPKIELYLGDGAFSVMSSGSPGPTPTPYAHPVLFVLNTVFTPLSLSGFPQLL